MRLTGWRVATMWAVVISAFAVLSSVALGGDSSPRRPKFLPAMIAGHWSGTWESVTAGTAGSISGRVRTLPHEKMGITIDFNGSIFGCGDPPPFSFSAPHLLHPGKLTARPASGWTSSGFSVSSSTGSFGRFRATYEVRDNSLVITGSNPLCNRAIAYSARGHLFPSRAHLKIAVEGNGSVVEKGTITMTKSK
jgi:hypothetical protein